MLEDNSGVSIVFPIFKYLEIFRLNFPFIIVQKFQEFSFKTLS